MSGETVPPNCEPLEHRTFSFYPAILNIEHNEWTFRKSAWSEICVVNTKSDVEIWIPRRFISEISSVDEPVMIVGLNKEIEFKAGTVWPHERRLLEMPRAMTEAASPASIPPPRNRDVHGAAVVRTAESAESRIGRLIGMVLGTVALICILVYAVAKLAPLRPVRYAAVDQDVLELTRSDDYFSVVRRLGPPALDRWRSETGELQYRSLWYPQRSCYLIFVGPDRKDMRYVGALDAKWRVLHWVELAGGGNTASMLRSLPKF